MKLFINILWDLEDIGKFIPKEITDLIQSKTWLKSRILQCIAKQVSGIVRGTKSKQNKRLFVHAKLLKQGKTEEAQELWEVIEENWPTKPKIQNIYPELDSRFIKVIWSKTTGFDGWIRIHQLGFDHPILLPFKKTSHFNKLTKLSELRPGLRLGRNQIFFNFKFEDVPKINKGNTLGVDVGIKKVFVSSDGQFGITDKDGWNLGLIQERLDKRKNRSKNFRQTQTHRKNFINWSVKRLNLSGVKELIVEDLTNMRKGQKVSGWMSHWSYSLIFDKLEQRCEENGVRITYIEPAYTSQRCNQCGWVQKVNRSGEKFKCKACGFELDADLNAAKNISLNLPTLSRKKVGNSNRTGFYWNQLQDEAPIVRRSPKTSSFS
jgi:IS605 OrfB family transposase